MVENGIEVMAFVVREVPVLAMFPIQNDYTQCHNLEDDIYTSVYIN